MKPRRHGARAPRRSTLPPRGFTYIGVLILLAVVSLASALTLEAAETSARRSAEAELVSIGREFERAFKTYHEHTPAGVRPYPQQLQDLVQDPRVPGVRRHLRRIYRDPLSGSTQWGTVAAQGGGIMGIYSLAPGIPMREAPPTGPLTAARTQGDMASANSYAQWRFGFLPTGSAGANAPGGR